MACMPVYKWSRFLARTDGRTGPIKGSTRGPRGPKKGKSNCPFSSDIGANCKSQDRYYSNHHKLKVTKEIELPGMRREGLDCIRARSWSQTIPIVSAPHVLKIQILAQNVFAMRVVFLHSSQSILGPGESKTSFEGEKCQECHFCYLPQYQPLSSSFSLFSISTIIFELMTYGRVIWRIMGSAIMDCCMSLPCSTSFGNQQRGR